jgi:hypothetical protein
MKRFLLSLVMAGVAGVSLAQTAPQNVFALGTHVLKQGVDTPVDLILINPAKVAGVQATLVYDPAVVQFTPPATTGGETAGGIIQGFGAVNYDVASPVAGMKAISFAIAASAGASKTGKVLTLLARPAAGAKTYAASPFTFSTNADDFVISDETSNPIATATPQPGTFIIGSPTVGASRFLAATQGAPDVTANAGITGSVSTNENLVFVVGDDQILRSLNPGDLTNPTAAGTFPAAGVNVGGTVQGRPVPMYDTAGAFGGVIVATTNGKVHRINADGSIKWTEDLTTITAGLGVTSTPAVGNGKVYVTDSSDTLRTLDLETGQPTGDTPAQITTGQAAGTQGISSPSFIGPAASIVVGGADGSIHRYQPDLTPQSSVALSTGSPITSSPFIFPRVGDTTLGFVGSQNGHVYVFDVGQGTIVGDYNPGDGASPIQNSPFGVSATQVVVVNNAGELHSVSASGSPLAVTGSKLATFSGGASNNQSPVVVGGNVWFGDVAGSVHFVPLAGGTPTDIKVGANPFTSPAVPHADTIVFASTDGNVYTFPTGTTTAAVGGATP